MYDPAALVTLPLNQRPHPTTLAILYELLLTLDCTSSTCVRSHSYSSAVAPHQNDYPFHLVPVYSFVDRRARLQSRHWRRDHLIVEKSLVLAPSYRAEHRIHLIVKESLVLAPNCRAEHGVKFLCPGPQLPDQAWSLFLCWPHHHPSTHFFLVVSARLFSIGVAP